MTLVSILDFLRDYSFNAIDWDEDEKEITAYSNLSGEPFSQQEFTVDSPTRMIFNGIEDYCEENKLTSFRIELNGKN